MNKEQMRLMIESAVQDEILRKISANDRTNVEQLEEGLRLRRGMVTAGGVLSGAGAAAMALLGGTAGVVAGSAVGAAVVSTALMMVLQRGIEDHVFKGDFNKAVPNLKKRLDKIDRMVKAVTSSADVRQIERELDGIQRDLDRAVDDADSYEVGKVTRQMQFTSRSRSLDDTVKVKYKAYLDDMQKDFKAVSEKVIAKLDERLADRYGE